MSLIDKEKRICTIYKITCLSNNKLYIGRTTRSLKQRFSQHWVNANAQNESRGKTKLARALKKYGKDNFVIEQLVMVNGWAESGRIETELIKKFESVIKGYNIAWGGEGSVGVIPNEKTRKKMSLARIGKVPSQETREKIRKSNTGKKFSKEHLVNMSKSQKGREFSEEHRAKLGKHCKGVLNNNSKGLVHTPYGIFESSYEAERSLNCTSKTIRNRCSNDKLRWKNWYFEKENQTKISQHGVGK